MGERNRIGVQLKQLVEFCFGFYSIGPLFILKIVNGMYLHFRYEVNVFLVRRAQSDSYRCWEIISSVAYVAS